MAVVLIGKNDKAPPAESLVGKYVLREGVNYWASYKAPRLVTGVVGRSSLEVEDPAHYWVEEMKGWVYGSADGQYGREAQPDTPVQLRVVRAICDTIEEVNKLLAIGREYDRKYYAVIKESREAMERYALTTQEACLEDECASALIRK